MSEKFDWCDSSIVVIPRQDAIAVYTNVNGEIVIRQQDRDATEDRIIILNPDYAEELIIALQSEFLEIQETKRLDREAADHEAEQ